MILSFKIQIKVVRWPLLPYGAKKGQFFNKNRVHRHAYLSKNVHFGFSTNSQKKYFNKLTTTTHFLKKVGFCFVSKWRLCSIWSTKIAFFRHKSVNIEFFYLKFSFGYLIFFKFKMASEIQNGRQFLMDCNFCSNEYFPKLFCVVFMFGFSHLGLIWRHFPERVVIFSHHLGQMAPY
jgi:hypothetical protein